jgi:hypothetical protein
MSDGKALSIDLAWAGRIGVRPSLGVMPTLERSKLYKDVWSRPCTKIAADGKIPADQTIRLETIGDQIQFPSIFTTLIPDRHLLLGNT